MSSPHLRGVLVPAGPQGLAVLRPAFEAALDAAQTGHPAPCAPIPAPGRLVTATASAAIAAAVRADEPVEHDDVVAVIATSGSTGDPKGVYWTGAALTHSTKTFAARFGTGTAVLALPLSSAAGAMALIRAVAANQATEPLLSLGGEQPFTIDDFVATTTRAQSHGAPLHVSLIDEQLRRLTDSPAGLAALRQYSCVLVGGGPVGDSVIKARAAGVHIHTSYGMTETCGGCWYDNEPLAGVSVTSSNDGRIVIKGPVVSPGYRFRANADLANGVFVTSDLGAVSDNRLTITGRVDDAVKINGVSVDLAAVERIVRQLTGAVHVVARAKDGLEVLIEAQEINTQELVAAVRDQLNARLTSVVMVEPDSLPRLPGGKLNVQQVRGQ